MTGGLGAEIDSLEQELQEICLRGPAYQSSMARDLRLTLLTEPL